MKPDLERIQGGHTAGLKKVLGPRIPTKLGYKNFYLYGSIEHTTGDHFNNATC